MSCILIFWHLHLRTHRACADLENGDQRVPAIRRPASASLRQPVRTNLGNGVERESLATQLRRVDEEQDKKQESKKPGQEKQRKIEQSKVAKDEIGPDCFLTHQLLGTGSFGEVFLVEEKSSGKLMAMKVLSK